MKQLIGTDIGGYVFDPAARQITLTGVPTALSLEQILLVTNVSTGTLIYSFADPALGATLAANVLTLAADTTAMQPTDRLQIFIQRPDEGAVASGLIERLTCNILKRLNVDSTGRLRVGDITLAGSQTLTTVTTLTTLTNLTNLTNWGVLTATAKSQAEGHQAFQQGFRRNLVVS